jgi:hypothetical protein
LAFPAAPPWPWRGCADLRGYPVPSHCVVGLTTRTTLLTFAVSREHVSSRAAGAHHRSPRTGPCGPRSGTSGSLRTPLPVFKDRPSADTDAARPLPVGQPRMRSAALRSEDATLRTRSALAVPPGFDGLRRFDILRVCCTPQPAMGFATFPALNRSCSRASIHDSRLPLWRHTLRSFSLDCSRTASPRPLPSRRSISAWTPLAAWRHATRVCQTSTAGLRALLHSRIRCGRLGVATESPPDAPLGFNPL